MQKFSGKKYSYEWSKVGPSLHINSDHPNCKSLSIDFSFSVIKNDPLLKAVGAYKKDITSIIDATFGLGNDCKRFLKYFECIYAYEENEKISFVGEHFASFYPQLKFFAKNCFNGNQNVDVVYLDPMYSDAKKGKALPNKRIQFITDVVGESFVELDDYFKWAKDRAKKRVVLKRPPKSKPYLKPDFQYKTIKTRYDVYLTRGVV